MIQNTWFYETNLKNYPELQETLLSTDKTKLELKSYLLCGNVGVGKTYNSILLARDYIQQTIEEQSTWNYRFEPCFISYMDFVQLLNNQRFGSEESKNKAYYQLKDITESKFLILDDLRCNHGSQYEKNTIDNSLLNLLSVFYADRKSRTLIVTSNNSEVEIRRAYSKAVCSRLFSLCEYLEVVGVDKRQEATKPVLEFKLNA